MAWVSVHDTVDGSKLREFAKALKCTKEEALGALVSLWMWGLKNADKTGRLPGADKQDILDAFSTKFASKAPNVVDALIENAWIDVDETGILILHDWNEWQAQWYKAVERREHDAKRKAVQRAKKLGVSAGKSMEKVDAHAEKSVENVNDAPTQKAKELPVSENISFLLEDEEPKASKYSVGFEEFWKVYPRKVDKGNAYKKYSARRKDGFSDEELLQAAKAYAAECQKLHTEQTYIKHPKTFLSDSLPFTDYIKKSVPKQQEFEVPETGNPFEDWSDSQ